MRKTAAAVRPEKTPPPARGFFCVFCFGYFLNGGSVQIGKRRAVSVLPPFPSKKPPCPLIKIIPRPSPAFCAVFQIAKKTHILRGAASFLHQAFAAGAGCPAQIARSRVIGGAAGGKFTGRVLMGIFYAPKSARKYFPQALRIGAWKASEICSFEQ